MTPLFEILCLSMWSRQPWRNRMLRALEHQCLDLGVVVPIRIRICDPQLTLGENRTILVNESDADYVCFFDDDDLPGDDYIKDILNALSHNDIDYVGFNVRCYFDGVPLDRITRHSLQYNRWYEDGDGFYRDISHINPIRRELAILEPFEGGHGEDTRWADRMRARGVLKFERYIDKTLYHYYFRTNKNSADACPKCHSKSTVRLDVESACNNCGLRYHQHEPRKSCLWD